MRCAMTPCIFLILSFRMNVCRTPNSGLIESRKRFDSIESRMHYLGVLLPTLHHLLHPLPHHGSATTVRKGIELLIPMTRLIKVL
jgi:hypothetical protein